MIQFFRSLITVWLSINSIHYDGLRIEALQFLHWIYSLKRNVFLPSWNQVGRNRKTRQIEKAINKIPTLSNEFLQRLNELEEIAPLSLPKSELDFLTSKRAKLPGLIEWLKNYDDSKLATLQQMLLDNPQPAGKTFTAKRNKTNLKK